MALVARDVDALYAQHRRDAAARAHRLLAVLGWLEWALLVGGAALLTAQGQLGRAPLTLLAVAGGAINVGIALLDARHLGGARAAAVLAQAGWSLALLTVASAFGDGLPWLRAHAFASLLLVARHRELRLLWLAAVPLVVGVVALGLGWPPLLIGALAATAVALAWNVRRFELEARAVLALVGAQAAPGATGEASAAALHNVGNIVNRVSTSAAVIGQLGASLTVERVAEAAERLQHDDGDAARLLPWLALAGRSLVAERARLRDEAALLQKSVRHIRSILAAPAGSSGGRPLAAARVDELIAEAVKLDAALESSGIELVRELEATPEVRIDRDQVLQIIVNLLSNARHAVSAEAVQRKRILVRSRRLGDACVIEVADSGAGIAADHLVKLFSYGFTTKAGGHGFGLHASAAAARELGGSLTARSDGPGCGAVFTLTLPIDDPRLQRA